MNLSQASSIQLGSRRISKDTFGPTTFFTNRGFSASGSDISMESSSHGELSLADSYGHKSSFRAIKDRGSVLPNGSGVFASPDDVEYELPDDDETHRKDVHVMANVEVNRATPDSVASSSRRLLSPQRGQTSGVVFDAGSLQQNYEQQRNQRGIAQTMRAELQINIQQERRANGEVPNMMATDGIIRKPKKKNKRCEGGLKLTATILMVMATIAAIVVLIHFKHNNTSNEQEKLTGEEVTKEPSNPNKTTPPTGQLPEPCPAVNVMLQEEMVIRCKNLLRLEQLSHIVMKPPSYVNEGRNINITMHDQVNMTSDWIPSRDESTGKLTIDGPPATCSSPGIYLMQFVDLSGRHMYKKMVNITVQSEVKKVNMTLSQPTTDGNDTDFKIGCSTNSGCEQSFVDFFADINTEEQHLRGVDFSCTITYTDMTGYSVSCVGTIPNYLLSQFKRITCRPRSSILDDLDEDERDELEAEFELPKCDISEHCGYTCDQPPVDYYAVDTGRCDIFHRCFEKRVYTQFCAPGTFFDPSVCACRHTTELDWCTDIGAVIPGRNVSQNICETE